ncbi:type IV secretory system conjugative DNA transfer family protein [Nocardia sp. CC201C]|uniref:type IV secretory system conjugative DNA transfer family protein n=1 Tax=Nocardia sp. CC201C TaxID=3044575 RepID=UPI0024A9A3EC|nr:type IV secretory system conjugative DNA transfer family protein [Nocardia sp. CC201C]
MVPNEQPQLPLFPDSIVWLHVWFPRPCTEALAMGLLRQWAAQAHAPQLILEARSSTEGVSYLIGCQLRDASAVQRTIELLVPGSQVAGVPTERGPVAVARRVRPSSPAGLLEPADAVASVRTVLSALMAVAPGEQLVLQVELGARRRPQAMPAELSSQEQSVLSKVLTGIQPEGRSDIKQALAKKLGQHGFSATVRIGAAAATSERRRVLLLGLASALGTVNAAGVHLELRSETPQRVNTPRSRSPRSLWPLVAWGRHLGASEVLRLTAWPVSDREEVFPGQASLHPRKLRPSPALLTGERVIATANAPGTAGEIGYGVDDACRHTVVLGPSGTGKSTLLLRLVVGDLKAGHPVVVIEPKDLVTDILSRIPKERKRDVVLLDPLDDHPVGINPLDRLRAGVPPEVVADNIFHIFHSLYGDALGRRSGDILRESLKAIALTPDPSLIMLPLILTDPVFRRPLVHKAVERDPFAAGTFWSWYEQLSPEGAMNNIAPLSNKVRPFLDVYLRGVLAQQHPRFNVRQVLEQKKVLLVPLQPGYLGADRAKLASAFLLAELWNAIRERATIPEAKRDPVMVYVDEVQEFLNLPVDLDDALATARGYRAGFHLSFQYSSQLPSSMARAFKNNARNKIAFQLGADDAKDMAAGQSVLVPEDFTTLPAHQVYAKLVRRNSVQPWASGATLPPPPETSDPAEIRRLSRQQYGRSRQEIEAEFRALLQGPAGGPRPPGPSRGRRRRQP